MTGSLIFEREGAVALVQLNRPEAMNAFNDEIRQAFPKLLAELDADPEVRAIVITGAGDRAFCAGADIKEARTRLSPVGERGKLMPTTWIESLDRVAKPVIAAIHGICLGGGLEIAMACDIRIAAANAKLGLTETMLGLIPGGGGTQRLPRLIGMSRALDMLLTAEKIDAAEAFRIGLVTRLAGTREEMLAEAMRIATLIASRPPAAIAYCKEAAIAAATNDLATGLRIEKSLFALLTGTADRAEAASAFAEKRPPRFTGE
nr:enoyl-CoA hydratase-related protein [Sphingomonas sp. Y57]